MTRNRWKGKSLRLTAILDFRVTVFLTQILNVNYLTAEACIRFFNFHSYNAVSNRGVNCIIIFNSELIYWWMDDRWERMRMQAHSLFSNWQRIDCEKIWMLYGKYGCYMRKCFFVSGRGVSLNFFWRPPGEKKTKKSRAMGNRDFGIPERR